MTQVYDDRYSNSESPTRYIKKRVTDVAPTLESDDDRSSKKPLKLKPAIWESVVAGGFAGVVVDLTLYPLDTFKTRLQSKEGFYKSGGLRNPYKGVIPVLFSSAPISALFFCIYNTLINTLRTENSSLNPLIYMVAATTAEVISGSVRVPVEIVKQRKQTTSVSTFYILRKILEREGFIGFYRGFSSVIVREVPFAAIQYPLWEYMLNELIIHQNGKPLTPFQTACCGSIAGAVAAVSTTPMDVIKTRIMLADRAKIEYYKPYVYINFAKEIYYSKGIRGFFAGVFPRTLWIMLGGFIYFGAYEKGKLLWHRDWSLSKKIEVNTAAEAVSYSDEKEDFFSKKDNIDNNSSETKLEEPEVEKSSQRSDDFLEPDLQPNYEPYNMENFPEEKKID